MYIKLIRWEYFNVKIGQASKTKCAEATIFALITLPQAQAVLFLLIDLTLT